MVGTDLLGYAPVGRAVPDFVANPRQLEEGWLDQASRLCSSWRQARYCARRCKPLVFPGFSQVPALSISVKLAQRIVWGGGHPADGRQLPQ